MQNSFAFFMVKSMGIGRSLFTALTLTALCYTSCEIGKRKARDPDYSIIRQGQQVYLAATNLGVRHEIRTIGREVYLGNLEHQLNGTRALATIEADSLAGRGISVKSVVDKIMDRLEETLR